MLVPIRLCVRGDEDGATAVDVGGLGGTGDASDDGSVRVSRTRRRNCSLKVLEIVVGVDRVAVEPEIAVPMSDRINGPAIC